MVTVAEALDTLYPIDTRKPIEILGFISGNQGRFNRHWFKAQDGDEAPGMGVLHATGASGEDTVNAWSAAELYGLGWLGWDRAQLATQATVYAAADLAPTYPFAENPGAYFRAYVLDTNGNRDAGLHLQADNTGGFEEADFSVRVYAHLLYYVADTNEVAARIPVRVAGGGGGG